MYFNVNFGRSPAWCYGELLVFVSLCNDLMMATHSRPKLVAKYDYKATYCDWKYLYIFSRKLQSSSSRQKLNKQDIPVNFVGICEVAQSSLCRLIANPHVAVGVVYCRLTAGWHTGSITRAVEWMQWKQDSTGRPFVLPARHTALRVVAVAAVDNGNEYRTISVAQRTSNKNDNGLSRHCVTASHGLQHSEMLLAADWIACTVTHWAKRVTKRCSSRGVACPLVVTTFKVLTTEWKCALLRYYAASSGDSSPTFRDNLWVPS
jgi:hypothetical protein